MSSNARPATSLGYWLSSMLFILCALATAWVSATMMETGFWSMLILAGAAFVALGLFAPVVQPLVRVFAGLCATIAVMAVLLGLLAATTGGSFRLPQDVAMLLFCMGGVFVFGLGVCLLGRPPRRAPSEGEAST